MTQRTVWNLPWRMPEAQRGLEVMAMKWIGSPTLAIRWNFFG